MSLHLDRLFLNILSFILSSGSRDMNCIVFFVGWYTCRYNYWCRGNLRNSHRSKDCLWRGNLWRKNSSTTGNFAYSGNVTDVGSILFGAFFFCNLFNLFDIMVVDLSTIVPWYHFIRFVRGWPGHCYLQRSSHRSGCNPNRFFRNPGRIGLYGYY